eukprot:7264239-Lingulodinium_polyedra.AAC.1
MQHEEWVVAGAFRWREREVIHCLEGRSAVWVARHRGRVGRCLGRRHLRIGDNMAVVCALDKGRASDYRLNLLCRQSAAISIFGNMRFYDRWIASERNPADAPSRVFQPGRRAPTGTRAGPAHAVP